MAKHPSCSIKKVGKQRNGRPRFWCSTHRASATGRYGARLAKCEAAYRDAPQNILTLDPQDFPGGIALWGAVAPVFDTTQLAPETGMAGQYALDETYSSVEIDGIKLDERQIQYFMAQSALPYLSHIRAKNFYFPLVIVECSPTCAAKIAALQAEGRIHFVDPNDIAADSFLDLLNIHELGEGETECLAICINSDHTFCCDDLKAREVAATLLGPERVVGSLRLLKWCVEEELISSEQAFQYYKVMRTAGGFLPDITEAWFSDGT